MDDDDLYAALGLSDCSDMEYRALEPSSATQHTHLWLVQFAIGFIIPARIGSKNKHSMHASIVSDEAVPYCND